MVGRRLQDGHYPVKPGDYSFVEGVWWAKPPSGVRSSGSLLDHQVTEHEDGTITVSPSILVHPHPTDDRYPGWHGWLERGVWREV